MDDVVEVTSYAEVLEALRASAKFAVVMDAESEPIRAGTVLRIDDEPHTKRRRLLNRLVFKGGHTRLRDTVLRPALERDLASVLARPDADGIPRADLIPFATRLLVELVAAMIGLDEAKSAAGLAELVRIHTELVAFPRLQTQLRSAAPPLAGGDATLREAIARHEAAKAEFVERFYRPAMDARRALVARHDAGELGDDDLPRDFLTMVAAHADPRFDDEPDLPVRHAIVDLLHAGTGTTVGALVRAIDELDRHLRAHPDDLPLRTDPAFLSAAVNETVRLHSANPAEIRRALIDLTLGGGTQVRAGQIVALRTGYANRDRTVFGEDAERFDPHRQVPAGVYPYGVAFGSGPHMCYGVPLVLGDEGTDGNLVCLLKRLYAVGVRPDPDRRPHTRETIAHADLKTIDSYPVVFRPD
ncbi:MAG TPA: cytochrome P450 [Candidatus Limnocylindria bacterium]|jgi:cytochrome P450